MSAAARAKKVIGVGLAAQDVLVLWEDAADPVNVARVADLALQGGGMTATALVAVARLGGRAELWGAVGDDWAAHMILRDLDAEGVDVAHVRKLPGEAGPVVLVFVDRPTGERRFPFARGLRGGEDIDAPLDRLGGAGALLVDGFRSACAGRVAEEARRRGVPVVGDVGGLGEKMRPLMPLMDYAIASEPCARSLDADPRRACEALRRMGPACAVVTLGDCGCVCLSDEGYLETPAFQVDVVDTTGAGDVFHGAFCFALTAGLALTENLVFSSAVAALKCRKLGGRAGLPTLAEVNAFLAERDLTIPNLEDALP